MPRRRADAVPEVIEAADLPARLVFSLLTAAVRVAARVEMPLGRLTDLLRTAYFLEYRRRHPRDLATVAQKLGVSLRTAGTLNRSLRDDFFAPETKVEPIRQVTAALVGGPASEDELAARTELSADEVRGAVSMLRELHWVEDVDGRLRLSGRFRDFVANDLERRIDGVNHQLSVIASSVWYRFAHQAGPPAGARSWTFAAREADVAPAMERIFQALLGEALGLEEKALEEGVARKYGITVAIAPLDREEP